MTIRVGPQRLPLSEDKRVHRAWPLRVTVNGATGYEGTFGVAHGDSPAHEIFAAFIVPTDCIGLRALNPVEAAALHVVAAAASGQPLAKAAPAAASGSAEGGGLFD